MCFDWNGVKFGALKHIRGFHIININYANSSSGLAKRATVESASLEKLLHQVAHDMNN